VDLAVDTAGVADGASAVAAGITAEYGASRRPAILNPPNPRAFQMRRAVV
jgi:hypothetical protein